MQLVQQISTYTKIYVNYVQLGHCSRMILIIVTVLCFQLIISSMRLAISVSNVHLVQLCCYLRAFVRLGCGQQMISVRHPVLCLSSCQMRYPLSANIVLLPARNRYPTRLCALVPILPVSLTLLRSAARPVRKTLRHFRQAVFARIQYTYGTPV